MIRIRTLGSLTVSRDGVALTGAGTQARRMAVLALIARAGARGITRDRIIALLWPTRMSSRLARRFPRRCMHSDGSSDPTMCSSACKRCS